MPVGHLYVETDRGREQLRTNSVGEKVNILAIPFFERILYSRNGSVCPTGSGSTDMGKTSWHGTRRGRPRAICGISASRERASPAPGVHAGTSLREKRCWSGPDADSRGTKAFLAMFSQSHNRGLPHSSCILIASTYISAYFSQALSFRFIRPIL